MQADSPSAAPPPPPAAPRRQRARRWLCDLAIFAVALLLIQWWQARHFPAGPAPDFAALAADGRSTSLEAVRAQHAGQPLALYFWAEWCPVCSLQQDAVDALGADWPLFTVAMQSGDRAAVEGVLRERGLRWNTAIDADGRIAALYGVHGVPALIVIGADGDIRASAVGYTTGPGMRLRMWWAQIRG